MVRSTPAVLNSCLCCLPPGGSEHSADARQWMACFCVRPHHCCSALKDGQRRQSCHEDQAHPLAGHAFAPRSRAASHSCSAVFPLSQHLDQRASLPWAATQTEMVHFEPAERAFALLQCQGRMLLCASPMAAVRSRVSTHKGSSCTSSGAAPLIFAPWRLNTGAVAWCVKCVLVLCRVPRRFLDSAEERC